MNNVYSSRVVLFVFCLDEAQIVLVLKQDINFSWVSVNVLYRACGTMWCKYHSRRRRCRRLRRLLMMTATVLAKQIVTVVHIHSAAIFVETQTANAYEISDGQSVGVAWAWRTSCTTLLYNRGCTTCCGQPTGWYNMLHSVNTTTRLCTCANRLAQPVA